MLGTWLENKSKIVHKFNRIHTQWRKIHLIRRRVVFVGGREEKPMESNFIYTAELSRDSWKVFSWMHDCLYIEDGAWYSLYFFTPPPSFHSIRSETSLLSFYAWDYKKPSPRSLYNFRYQSCQWNSMQYKVYASPRWISSVAVLSL